MKEIVFNRKDYASYKDFYADVYDKLDGKENWDFDYCTVPLGYSADTLDEFLWYCHNDNIKYIFVDFDKDKIALQKIFDDYKYKIIIEVFEDFVKNYPNNQLEFRMDDNKKLDRTKENTMKEIIFNRKDYASYKDFYTQIYKDLDGKSIPDWEDYPDLCYSADGLNEFLWYYYEDNIKYIFVDFDKDKIALQKNYDDYEFNLVIRVFERFVKNYPNNQLEFRMESNKN